VGYTRTKLDALTRRRLAVLFILDAEPRCGPAFVARCTQQTAANNPDYDGPVLDSDDAYAVLRDLIRLRIVTRPRRGEYQLSDYGDALLCDYGEAVRARRDAPLPLFERLADE
jgi:hypothetical protein